MRGIIKNVYLEKNPVFFRIFMDLIQAARTDHSHHTDLSEHRIELTELMAQLKISPHIQVRNKSC